MGSNKFNDCDLDHFKRMATNMNNLSIRTEDIENGLLNKEFENGHYDILLDEIKTICRSTCEAIDSLFENLTATINSLRNVLIWKSQVQLIPEKIARALNSNAIQKHSSQPSNNDSCFSCTSDSIQSKSDKKCGTAKVSPMVKGHIISAPRIHLNRISKTTGSGLRLPLTNTLSPIMEQSPSSSPHNSPSPVFKNIQVPLQRLKVCNFAGQTAESEESNEADASSEINFNGRNCAGFELRRKYNSLGENERFRMMRHRRVEVVNGNKHQEEVAEDADHMSEDIPSCRSEGTENDDLHDKSRRNISDDADPLEGPSWLLNKQQLPEEACHFRYVNYNRLNYARSKRALSDENTRDASDFSDEAQLGNFELTSTEQEVLRENSFSLANGTNEKNSFTNKESSNKLSSSGSERCEEHNILDDFVGRSKVNSLSSRYSSENRNNLKRNSVCEKDESMMSAESESRPRKSNGKSRLSKSRISGNNSLTPRLSMDCYVHLNVLPLENNTVGMRESLKNLRGEPTLIGRGSAGSTTPRKHGSSIRKTAENRKVSDENQENVERMRRTKRRAAEECIEKKKWLDVTPKWEAKIKREKAGRKRMAYMQKRSKKRNQG